MPEAVQGSVQPQGDAAAIAAAAAAAAGAGTPPATNGAAKPEGSGNGAAADPFAGLETGTREWVGKKGYKSVGDLATAALSAESLIGKSVQVPAADAKPEDWAKFYAKVGRPEKPDGYEFALPAGVPKDMPYDGEFATAFKAEAHKAGLTAKQATAAHDFYVAKMADAFKREGEAHAAKATSATEALEGKWGKRDSDGFKNGVEDMTRAVKQLGIETSLKEAGLFGDLDGKTYVVDAPLALALATVGKQLFREGEMVTGTTGGSANNPFDGGPATIAEPGKPAKGNLTAQMAAIRSDPAKAKRDMRAAGRKPSEWGLTDD